MSKNDTFDRARDELFSHINRCGVLKAAPDQQAEWMNDTMDYMSERFPELSSDELEGLRAIGLRFCQPVIARAPHDTASEANSTEEDSAGAETAAA